MNKITLWIPGDPVPKGRGRIMSSGAKRWTVTPARTRIYEEAVREVAQGAIPQPLDGPLYVRLTFHVAKPRYSRLAWPISRPDLDNLAKAVLDGLNGAAWRDDSQVVCLDLAKIFADGEPGVKTEIVQL